MNDSIAFAITLAVVFAAIVLGTFIFGLITGHILQYRKQSNLPPTRGADQFEVDLRQAVDDPLDDGPGDDEPPPSPVGYQH